MKDEFDAFHYRLEEERAQVRHEHVARLKAEGYRIVKLRQPVKADFDRGESYVTADGLKGVRSKTPPALFVVEEEL